MGLRTVNARQLEILRWIGQGSPPNVLSGTTYKTTAVALRNGRLVKITKRHGIWAATVTDAGRHFLDRGSYPTGHWDVPERGMTPGQVAKARRDATRPAVGAMPSNRTTLGTSLNDTAQEVGTSIGTAVIGTMIALLVTTTLPEGVWSDDLASTYFHGEQVAFLILAGVVGAVAGWASLRLTDSHATEEH